MGCIKKDTAYESVFNYASSYSPRLLRFLGGLNDGSAPIKWALLDEIGAKQSDGTYFRILSGYRDYESQVAEYKRGRVVSLSRVEDSRGYRYKILSSSVVNASAVSTRAFGGQSYHNYGLAVDLVVRKLGDAFGRGSPVRVGSRSWDNLTAFYTELGLLDWARSCGLTWGGSWSDFWDLAHWEDDNFVLPSGDIFNYMCNFKYVARGSVPSSASASASGGARGGGLLMALLVVGVVGFGLLRG